MVIISLSLDKPALEVIDKLAKKLFEGNRSLAVRHIVRLFRED